MGFYCANLTRCYTNKSKKSCLRQINGESLAQISQFYEYKYPPAFIEFSEGSYEICSKTMRNHHGLFRIIFKSLMVNMSTRVSNFKAIQSFQYMIKIPFEYFGMLNVKLYLHRQLSCCRCCACSWPWCGRPSRPPVAASAGPLCPRASWCSAAERALS